LIEKITVADDRESFHPTLVCTLLDNARKPVEGGGAATGGGTRIGF
jgi:hypothetical protein